MLIASAYAQTPGGTAGGFDLFSLAPLVLIFVVFWFLLIRPQQRKVKQHREMIAAVRRGDRVLTGGGIVGTVTKVLSDTELQVEIAEDVRVKVARSTISEVLAKTEPAKGTAAEERSEEEEAEEASKVKGRGAKS